MNGIFIEQTSSNDLLNQIEVIIEDKLRLILNEQPKKELEEKFLTIQETANYLGICKTSVYNYSKKGFLKPTRIGNTTRYLKSELTRFNA